VPEQAHGDIKGADPGSASQWQIRHTSTGRDVRDTREPLCTWKVGSELAP